MFVVSPPRRLPPWLVSLCLTACLLAFGGCSRPAAPATDETAARVVRVWSHQGQESENRALREIAAAFNAAHADQNLRVELTFFPDFQYSEKLAIAAAARDLPDAFDLDGPLVARLAGAGLLAPLDTHFSPDELADFLPTVIEQGTVDGRLRALGAFDSATVLYYDRAMLARAGVSPPPAGVAWTWDEFLAACSRLRDAGIEPLGMHMDESADEWFTYAFSPVVWSGGGGLISPDAPRVHGILASPENIRALSAWREVFARGYSATDPVDPDPFGKGKVAMDWSGHWMAQSHLAAKGDRLGVMPLPRAGARSVAPCGSWCWAVSSRAADTEGALAWLRWVTATETGVVPLVRANSAVPARRSAFAAFPEYSDYPYKQFRSQLETSARARPRTPFYATLTARFAGALRDIARGADVEARLRQAEDEIQSVIDRRARSAKEAARP